MHALTTYFLHLIDHFGFAGLFVAMTLGNVGAPVGSEIVLPAAGALVATHHLSNVWIAIAVAVVAELAGQSIAYAIGFYGGRPFVDRFGKYVRFHKEELHRAEGFFARYGSFAVFICRFVPVIRGIIGIPAGIAEMPLVPFYLWTLCGSVLFCGGLIWLGMVLGEHSHEVVDSLRRYVFAVVALVIVAIIAYVVIRRRRTA